jgi:hypothetical protein
MLVLLSALVRRPSRHLTTYQSPIFAFWRWGSSFVSTLSIDPALMITSPVTEHDEMPACLRCHCIHNISEDVSGGSSEIEDEEPAQPVAWPPHENIRRLRLSTRALQGNFAIESRRAPTSTPLRAFSMLSAHQQRSSARVPEERPSHSPFLRGGSMGGSRRRWRYVASNADPATSPSQPTLLCSHKYRRQWPSTCPSFLDSVREGWWYLELASDLRRLAAWALGNLSWEDRWDSMKHG